MAEDPHLDPARAGSPTDVDPGADETAPGGRGMRATLLLAGAVVAAFLVGMAGVAILAGDSGPQTDADGVVIGAPPSLEDRVAPDERQPLPDTVLAGFPVDEADPVDLTAYRGVPLVVNFWASWCAPCVKEMPDFQRFSEELGDRVPLLGVNVQDAPSNAQAFVDELGITYDLATDPRGELYTDVRGFGMPTTLFVDAEGTIVYRHTGPLDTAQLRALVGEHLGVEV
jgi:cytochrome c biogenesis protein CcmG, thiol:disulfide interchange protein DsbE